MSDYGNLSAQLRKSNGKGAARSLRRAGLVPGVIYGAGEDNVSVAFSAKELRTATNPDKQLNTLYSITLQDDGKDVGTAQVMIADLQRVPLKQDLMHVDFMRVDADKEITREVPVVYEGRAAGVAAGGKLKKFLKSLKVAAKPADIPTKVVVNLTPLEAGQYMRLKDIELENARIVANLEQPSALVELPKAKKEGEEEEEKKK